MVTTRSARARGRRCSARGGLSWWNYRAVADLLAANGHRVVLPVLDGHAGSTARSPRSRTTPPSLLPHRPRARRARRRVRRRLLGAQVASRPLRSGRGSRSAPSSRARLCSPCAARAPVAPAVALSYPLVRRSWFARAQFASLHLPRSLYEPYYRDSCAISKRDMIAFMRANGSYG